MIVKREICLYCGNKMESKTAKKKFCSDKCKVYWNREKKSATSKNADWQKSFAKKLYISRKVNDEVFPNIDTKPERKEGEGSLDYRIRLAEWNEQQNINHKTNKL